MKDETRKKFDELFERHDAKQELAKKEADEESAEEDAFVGAFHHCRLTVIRPVMETFATLLRERGHGSFISEEDERDDEGRARDANIRLNVYPGQPDASRPGRLSDTAGVAFAATGYKKKVWVHVSTIYPGSGSGHSGGTGAEYSPGQITAELAEQVIMDALTEIFETRW